MYTRTGHVATRPDFIYPPSDATFTHTLGLRLFDPDGFPRLTNTPPAKVVGDVPVWRLHTVEADGRFLTASGGMAVHSNGVAPYDAEARARAKYGDPPPWVAADPALLEEWHFLRRRERVEMSLSLVPEAGWDGYTAALAAAMAGVPQPGAPAPVAPPDTNRVAFARVGGVTGEAFNFDLYTPGDLPVDIFSKTNLAGGPLWSYAGTVQAAAPFTPAAVLAPHAALFLYAARGDIDSDGDGIPDGMELLHFGTDPTLWDTCGDGLSDWEEIYRYGLDPLLRDSDGDGIDDGDEIAASYSRAGGAEPFDTGGGTNLLSQFSSMDDARLTITLPIPVSIGGVSYTAATLDINGLIYLWPAHAQPTTPAVRYSNVDLAQTTLSERGLALAPFWDDMRARPAELGTAIVMADVTRHGKRYCVIEYRGMGFYGVTASSNDMVSFQVALPQTGTNGVAFIYAAANGRGTGGSATVGLQGAGGSPNLPVAHNTPGSIAAGDAITFRIGTGTNPLLSDSDGDGLPDGEEVALGTSPLLADTDGDGVLDMDYVKNGFAAAAPDDFAEVPVSVGDPSGSDSERWNITLAPLDEGGRAYVVASGGYGEMKTLPLRLQRGHRYRATLQHCGTRLATGPDYDWEAQVCGLPAAKVLAAGQTHAGASRWFASAALGVAVDNADGLLGRCDQDFSDVDNTQGKEAIIYVIKVNIENTTLRDTDDIQVQYFTNNASVFTYTAIPLQIYYHLRPDFGWTPSSVELRIKNPAGSTIRTIGLPSDIGQQQTSWDGKNSVGEYVPYGSNYIVEVIATINGVVATATNPLTVYEIRQGNCAYTPFAGSQYHAAIVYEYLGGNLVADIDDLSKYTVFEHPGEAGGNDTRVAPMTGHAWDYWCPTLTRTQRKAILEKATDLAALTIPYVSNWSFIMGNAIVHDNTTGSPAGTDWAGTFADIRQLRCDGAVEAVYEAVPVRLWGATAWWNIMTPGAQAGSNLARHTAAFSGLTPARQRQDNDPGMTQNAADALHLP